MHFGKRSCRRWIALAAVPGIIAQSAALALPSVIRDTATAAAPADTQLYVAPFEILITAPRMSVPLKENPAATFVVGENELATMPRSIAADEALKFVPGLKVDNQADGERVHLSIRGQGILTERGIRGIKILLDGLPLNDPSGFAPDLYDVDWATVSRIEILRGPAAALYGGGGAGGILNIVTKTGGDSPAEGNAVVSSGSYGFWKGLGEIGGTSGGVDYRFSASRTRGDGYRTHTSFWGNNFYGKASVAATPSLSLNAVLASTDFYNDNAEGLNLAQVARDPQLANPDALTFNEYQQTGRFTAGVGGSYAPADNQNVSFGLRYRHTNFRESVPSSVQHRSLRTPGAMVQYAVSFGDAGYRNVLAGGSDLDWQSIDEYRHPNLGGGVENDSLLSNENISQRGIGFYLTDRLEVGPQWGFTASIRYDEIRSQLDDLLKAGGADLSGLAIFHRSTARVGATFNPLTNLSLYASWGSGFLPPATEELVNNPDHLGGFNTRLFPATSQGFEGGMRGTLGKVFVYDIALFALHTDNDFDRYRIPTRPLETFYRNGGSTQRYGSEMYCSWQPVKSVVLQAAYTLSNFKYTSRVDMPDLSYSPWMPNSPMHQAYLDAEVSLEQHLALGIGLEGQSRSYVDATNIPSTPGYLLVHPRISYRWGFGGTRGELLLAGHNVLGRHYVAFSEPDPDGNSYHPAPTAELFATLKIWVGS